MIRFLTLILVLLPFSSFAQAVAVTSGEHDGFSRLVLTLPKPADWLLQRTQTGYVFSTRATKSEYDLSDVYRRINPDRLTRIEPNEQGLQLTLNCVCHAIPFELRPGIVVIDLKDGAAPDGSSFELEAGGVRLPPLAKVEASEAEQELAPEASSYVAEPVLIDAISGAARIQKAVDLLPVQTGQPSLNEARDELLWRLSKGAAEGVVEVTEGLDHDQTGPGAESRVENIQIGAGIDAKSANQPIAPMTAVGTACLPDSELEISAWSGAENIVSGFSDHTTHLVGEFDHPNETAVRRSVRFYLALGFGAEARQILKALKVSLPDQNLLNTISYIVDLEMPPGAVLDGMEVCDTSAALWAVLALDEIPPTRQVAIPAVLRSFSALPRHLRNHLGPPLANRFLAWNDPVTARAIRDAILRAPGEVARPVQMLEAEIALANDDAKTAEEILLPMVGSSGPEGIQSALTVIEQQVHSGQEVSSEMTTAAEALLAEAVGGQDEAVLRTALAKAYASQDRFSDAFDVLAVAKGDAGPVWTMLAKIGSDSAVITHAIMGSKDALPVLDVVTDRIFARRLLDLGFPGPATHWVMGDHHAPAVPLLEDTLLIAEAHIARNDGIRALRALEGYDDAAATVLKAKASALLQSADAASLLANAGQDAAAAYAARAQNDWTNVARLPEDSVWQDAAKLVEDPVSPDGETSLATGENATPAGEIGELAMTRAILEESAAARGVLEALLADQKVP